MLPLTKNPATNVGMVIGNIVRMNGHSKAVIPPATSPARTPVLFKRCEKYKLKITIGPKADPSPDQA